MDLDRQKPQLLSSKNRSSAGPIRLRRSSDPNASHTNLYEERLDRPNRTIDIDSDPTSLFSDDEDEVLEDEFEAIVIVAAWAATRYSYLPLSRKMDVPYGIIKTQQHMNCRPEVFYEFARMWRPSFMKLLEWCCKYGNLLASRHHNQDHIEPVEKFLIFFEVTCQGMTMRNTSRHWNRSISTISRCFHEVLAALLVLKDKIVNMPREDAEPCSKIRRSNAWYPYFKDVVGAIDGTHVTASVGRQEPNHHAWYNRKGVKTQNVMLGITFDRQFCFAIAGWEGSAHDARIMNAARAQGQFTFEGIRDKYFLVDGGFASTKVMMKPYSGVRYHLTEYGPGDRAPQNKEELYNKRHSSLRIEIECAIGCWKRRFRILERKNGPELPLDTQVKLVLGLIALQNWILADSDGKDPLYDLAATEVVNGAQERAADTLHRQRTEAEARVDQTREDLMMVARRDVIATRMWVDYCRWKGWPAGTAVRPRG